MVDGSLASLDDPWKLRWWLDLGGSVYNDIRRAQSRDEL
jgi:hypothetical protein